jgi:hypothetical protein
MQGVDKISRTESDKIDKKKIERWVVVGRVTG